MSRSVFLYLLPSAPSLTLVITTGARLPLGVSYLTSISVTADCFSTNKFPLELSFVLKIFR